MARSNFHQLWDASFRKFYQDKGDFVTQRKMKYPLSGYRALDLTDEKGMLCGKILASLGADVIKIERPRGDPARTIGPFYHDEADSEKSLFWFYYNTNKRSVTLNIETTDGQEIFKELTKHADFLLESFPPGYMNKQDLGYSRLSGINPRIIYVSISPFGQTGPYCHYRVTDIAAMALGGMMYVIGDPDRPPVRVSASQAYNQGGVHAAMAVLLALYQRESIGEGQYIDVSIQQAITRCLVTELPFWEYEKTIIRRSGSKRLRGSTLQQEIWPCQDGYVTWRFIGGRPGARQMRALVEWMDEEGEAGDLKNVIKRWETIHLSQLNEEEVGIWETLIAKFFRTRTKQKLYSEALRRGVTLNPVNTLREIAKDPQLEARNFWVKVRHTELETEITYPGHFFLTGMSQPGIRRAPSIGEHNYQVYKGELGFSEQKIDTLRAIGII